MPVLPHSFQDNVEEIASGVQVDENFDVLNAAIEALEAAQVIGPVSGRVERAFGAPFLASGTHNTLVTGDVNLEPSPGFGAIVQFKVAGVLISPELFAHESIAHPMRVGFAFPVPAGQQWEAIAATPGHVSSLHTSYCPI